MVDFFSEYLPSEKIYLIPHAVDADYFRPRKSKQKKEIFTCLSVGSWKRDYETVFSTAEALLPQNNIEFHIVSQDLTIPGHLKNVKIFKELDDKRLLEMYQDADLLFMPFQQATANNVILESLACGLPVMTNALSATSYYMPGDEALLLKGSDPQKFAEEIKKITIDKEKHTVMVNAARSRALELSCQTIAKDYQSLYQRLLAHQDKICT